MSTCVPAGDIPLGSLSQAEPSAKELIRRSEEHMSELQSQSNIVCRLLLEKKKECVTRPRRVGGAGLPGAAVEAAVDECRWRAPRRSPSDTGCSGSVRACSPRFLGGDGGVR